MISLNTHLDTECSFGNGGINTNRWLEMDEHKPGLRQKLV